MTRSKAIEHLKNIAIYSVQDGYTDEARQALYMAIKALEQPHWIPCSERPPKVGTTVFITKEPFKINGYEQEVIKAKRSVDPRSGKIEWWSPEFGTLTDKVVLAWMPLPEPYRGENDE